jgi:pimeloyl-ACP methyl ester carboxylesterase
MPQARVGDLTLEYRTTGNLADPALALVMGTAAPLTMWDDAFCVRLADLGLHVVRFDYRDTGRSTHVAQPMPPSIPEMMEAFARGQLKPPYRLEDLADDVIGLLDALGIQTAHLLGLSQGGGVAQLAAARAPERVRALTLVATSTAGPDVPPPSAETMAVLLTDLPTDRPSFIAWNELMYTKTGSTNPPPDVAWIRARAERTWDYGWSAAGFLRHLLAVISATDRTPLLRKLAIPVSIVHGASDPIFPIAAAHQVAEAIPGARLRVVPGMGHDLAPVFWDAIVDAVREVSGVSASASGSPGPAAR